jgi:hypothetical protein
VIEDSQKLYGQAVMYFATVSCLMVLGASLSGGEFGMFSMLQYTQGIIREATAALLEDMTGHWIGDLPAGGSTGVNECNGT